MHAGQLDADSKAGNALKNVDRRTPLNARIVKIGEMDLGDLVGNFANLPFENTKTKRTGFLAHRSQWTRWPNDATARVQELTAPGELVDKSTIDEASTGRDDAVMKQKPEPASSSPSETKPRRPRQIIGFSLPPELAVEVKMEAARREISLRKLFVELWALYSKKNLH